MASPVDPSTVASIDWDKFLTALVGLGGVAVGGMLQWAQARSIADRQRADRKQEAIDTAATREREGLYLRAFPSLAVARHLERYAKACADTADINMDPVGSDDAEWDLPGWTAWPTSIQWSHLGASNEARARDLVERRDLLRIRLQGDLEHIVDRSEGPRFVAAVAAQVGLEAWFLAKNLRAEAQLPPFQFPDDGWNYVETLERFSAIQVGDA